MYFIVLHMFDKKRIIKSEEVTMEREKCILYGDITPKEFQERISKMIVVPAKAQAWVFI